MVPHPRCLIPVALILLTIATTPDGVSATYPPGAPPKTTPFGQTGIVEDYELSVVNVEPDADALLRAFDPDRVFMTDTAWVMIQIEATYTGDRVGDPGDDMLYVLHDGQAGYFDSWEHACDRWPFPPDRVRLDPGESARFNLCFQVPLWLSWGPDADLIVHTNLLTDQWPVPFSLDAQQVDRPDCGCMPPPPCSCIPPAEVDTA